MNLPTIEIHGKEYVLVSERVIFFNENYKNGSITSELVSKYDDNYVVVKSTIIPDCEHPERKFTGYSQTTWGEGNINKTSALENAETSAVGRALAMMGIGVVESIASGDEINKAKTYVPNVPKRILLNPLKKTPAIDNNIEPDPITKAFGPKITIEDQIALSKVENVFNKPPEEKKQLSTTSGTVDNVTTKTSDPGATKPWKYYSIQIEGIWYNTFSESIGKAAEELLDKNVNIVYTTDEYKGKEQKKIISISAK